MIKALQDNFRQSLGATDVDSRAYSGMLKGTVVLACDNAKSHVARRLLLIHFLDICKGLDKNIGMQTEVL
jgi:hypothetical protein